MKYLCTPTSTRMVKIKNINNTNYWQQFGATRIPTHCRWKCEMSQPLWESLAVSYKFKIYILCELSTPFQGIT